MDKLINIKKILEDKGANKTKVASLVFPQVKFPKKAFARVLTGKKELTASQIAKVADYLGVSIQDLYEPGLWKSGGAQDGNCVFICGTNFRAELNTQDFKTKLYYKDELIVDELVGDESITLIGYLHNLEELIKDWIDLL